MNLGAPVHGPGRQGERGQTEEYAHSCHDQGDGVYLPVYASSLLEVVVVVAVNAAGSVVQGEGLQVLGGVELVVGLGHDQSQDGDGCAGLHAKQTQQGD